MVGLNRDVVDVRPEREIGVKSYSKQLKTVGSLQENSCELEWRSWGLFRFYSEVYEKLICNAL